MTVCTHFKIKVQRLSYVYRVYNILWTIYFCAKGNLTCIQVCVDKSCKNRLFCTKELLILEPYFTQIKSPNLTQCYM